MTLEPPASERASVPTRRSLRQAALTARDEPVAAAPVPRAETVALTVAAARELAARLIAGEPEHLAAAQVLKRQVLNRQARLATTPARGLGALSATPADSSAPLPVLESSAPLPVPSVSHPLSLPSARHPLSIPSAPRSVGPARRAKRSFRRFSAVGVPAGAMGIAALLAAAMALPTTAIAGGSSGATTSLVASSARAAADEVDIQAFVTEGDVPEALLQGAEGFTAVSQAQVATESGIRFSDSLYTNDATAKIQWPYVVGVAMSSPFGMRDGVMHEGIDLVPGNGAPIQAIAAGTVRLASESDGGYGVGVYIDHLIDGKVVTSHYGHMQYGSLKVRSGDRVKVGDPVGRTGDTGHSFGPHLHFEIIVDGAKIDPQAWMLTHAGRR